MLKRHNFFFIALLMMTASSSACGSSKSGGSPTGTVVSQSAADAVVIALDQTKVLDRIDPLPASNSEPFPVPGEKADAQTSDPERIQSALTRFKNAIMQEKLRKIEEQIAICESGDAVRTIDDNDTPLDERDDSVSTQYNDCLQRTDSKTIFRRGTFSKTVTETELKMSYTNFLYRETDTRTRTITESFRDGSTVYLQLPEDLVVCGEKVLSKKRRVTANLSISETKDNGGNGSLDRDISYQIKNWTMDLSEVHSPVPDCKATIVELLLNGGIAVSNADRPEDDSSIGFSDFGMTLKADIKSVEGFVRPVSGTSVSFSGLIAVRSPCSFGTFTVSTPLEDRPFFPKGERCATLGRYIVSTKDGEHAVIATPRGSVQIDEGNDGSIDEERDDCRDAGTCSRIF